MGILSTLFGARKVKTTADRPFVIANPTLGFANLKGAEGTALVEVDASAIGPLFPKVVKSEGFPPPKCQVLFLYCDLDAAGNIIGGRGTIREIVAAAGAYVAVVASPNASQAYITGMQKRIDWSANISLVLDRRGDKVALFFRRVFELMFTGESMLMAWVAVAPQAPGHDDPDAPETMMIAEAGHVTFSKT